MKSSERRHLKQLAHHLSPVILLGNKGLTPAVLEETEHALNAHELIKIKLGAAPKEDQVDMTKTLCASLHATLIQSIGHIVVIYRKKTK